MKKILIGLISICLIVMAGLVLTKDNNQDPYSSGIESPSETLSTEIVEVDKKQLSDNIADLTIDAIDGNECNQFIHDLNDGKIASFTYDPINELFDTFCSQSLQVEEKTFDALFKMTAYSTEEDIEPIGITRIATEMKPENTGVVAASLVHYKEDVYLGFSISQVFHSYTTEETVPYIKFDVNFYTIDGIPYFPIWCENDGAGGCVDYKLFDSTYQTYAQDFQRIQNWYFLGEGITDNESVKGTGNNSVEDYIREKNKVDETTLLIPSEDDLNLEYLEYETVREMIEASTKEIIAAN